MIKAARFSAFMLLLAAGQAAGAMQAAPPADVRPDSVLACGLEAFGEADERLFGDSYAFARAHATDRDPPERKGVIGRLDAQLEICKRRDRLNADQLQIVNVYAANQILLRGAASYLRSQSVDPAKLDPLAERLPSVDVAKNPDPAFIARHAAAFNEAAVPPRLHAAAADYLAFARRDMLFRGMWASARPRAAPPAN